MKLILEMQAIGSGSAWAGLRSGRMITLPLCLLSFPEFVLDVQITYCTCLHGNRVVFRLCRSIARSMDRDLLNTCNFTSTSAYLEYRAFDFSPGSGQDNLRILARLPTQ